MKVYLRVWQELDIEEIKNNLFIIGELKGECFNCHKIDIPLEKNICPNCNREFKFLAFRRRLNNAVIKRFHNSHPSAYFIDYEDFKQELNRKKAKKFLGI